MTTTFADAVSFGGKVSLGTSGYYEQIKIGDGTPAHADSADDLYVEGKAEFLGKIWLTGSALETDAAFQWLIPDNTATGLRVMEGANNYMIFDSVNGSENVEVAKEFHMSASGWKNHAAGTNSHRQPEFFEGSLAAAAGGGGLLEFTNPWAVAALVIDFAIKITTASTPAETGDFGVAAAGTTSDTLIDGVNLQTMGAHDNVDDAGTNGGRFVPIGAAQRITGTGSGAATDMVGTWYASLIVE